MSNQLRKISRKMQKQRAAQIPAKMVPIFMPIYLGLEQVVKHMNDNRPKVTTPDQEPEPATNVVAVINSTLASAVNAYKAQQDKPQKKEPGLIQVAGGDVARKIKASEKKMER